MKTAVMDEARLKEIGDSWTADQNARGMIQELIAALRDAWHEQHKLEEIILAGPVALETIKRTVIAHKSFTSLQEENQRLEIVRDAAGAACIWPIDVPVPEKIEELRRVLNRYWAAHYPVA